MLPLARKSVEPIAARVDPLHVSARQLTLHHFAGKSGWSDVSVMARVCDWVMHALGLVLGCFWTINDTGFPKQGKHSEGGHASSVVSWAIKIIAKGCELVPGKLLKQPVCCIPALFFQGLGI